MCHVISNLAEVRELLAARGLGEGGTHIFSPAAHCKHGITHRAGM